jgi:hypothetical protein
MIWGNQGKSLLFKSQERNATAEAAAVRAEETKANEEYAAFLDRLSNELEDRLSPEFAIVNRFYQNALTDYTSIRMAYNALRRKFSQIGPVQFVGDYQALATRSIVINII